MNVRPIERTEVGVLARLWYDGWQDAHAEILPSELARHRTLENFTQRLEAELANVRALGPVGAPLGFHLLKGDELNQLYVSAQSRGTGVAAALIADAERQLFEDGVETAWLACAIGNERAARFYEKCGRHRVDTVAVQLEIPHGAPFTLRVWRYEKPIRLAEQRDSSAASV
jgi:GNAT superfamily N-acetyltransferase